MLEAGVQICAGSTPLFPWQMRLNEYKNHRRWQRRHKKKLDPPPTWPELFGWPIPMPDFGWWLVWHLNREDFLSSPHGTRIDYRTPEATFYVSFWIDHETVVFTSSWELSPTLRVTIPAFDLGVRGFIADLLATIQRYAPDLMAWDIMQPLIAFHEDESTLICRRRADGAPLSQRIASSRYNPALRQEP